tara:strand:- start:229 stop:408 length:180 start_codon:yes stop_codon:yes gene_type:complete
MRKHQIKSCYYYTFWGLATISVVLGQVFVGTGYRYMAESIEYMAYSIEEIRKEIVKAPN